MLGVGLSISKNFPQTIGAGGVAPSIVVDPVLSGTAAVGNVLTSTTGTWSGDLPISYSYVFLRTLDLVNFEVIQSGSSNAYTVLAGDFGYQIRVNVIATNGISPNGFASSNYLGPIVGQPVNTVAPAISGIQIVGQTLITTNGTWTGTPTITFTYQWQRSIDGGSNWTNIIGATANTHVVQASGAGNLTRCVVTASNGVGVPVSANSNSLSILATLLDIDSVGIEEAYHAFQLLRGGYFGSPLIRVRRSSDNAEQNFGVTNSGVLDTAALLSFVGAGNNGFVVTIFSQRIGGNNLNQSNASLQGQIVSAGAMIQRGGVNTILMKTNDTFTKTSSNLSTAYSIFTHSEFGIPVRHGDIGGAVNNTWPLNWSTPPVMGWRREIPLNYLQVIAINTTFSKKAKVRNSFDLTLNINKVLQYTNSGNFTDTNNLAFTGFIVPLFGAADGTTYQRCLVVYSSAKTFTQQNSIFDLI